ncbi:MAG TPA: NADH-quinone oxidoreductase subunit A [Terriglobales bacterium]|nr:NADH-quinone oxidoreductase subunit A [Terriglobales bacterium]
MILSAFAVVGLSGLFAVSVALLGAAVWRRPVEHLQLPSAWKQYRFGFATYSLIFLAFDMEMIFMYPWAVVFAGIGMKAFGDMLVFICLLSSGIAYAWAVGGLEWE